MKQSTLQGDCLKKLGWIVWNYMDSSKKVKFASSFLSINSRCLFELT